MLNLEALLSNLQSQPIKPSGGRILAIPIPGYERHRIALDDDGSPTILIAIQPKTASTAPLMIQLEHLQVESDVSSQVTQAIEVTGIDGVVEEGTFTFITCCNADAGLHRYFLQIMEPIIGMLGPTPKRSDVTRAVLNLVELFRIMTRPSRGTVQGLWAELFLIARAPEVAPLVKSWHVEPEDTYDFNSGNQRLEVKSVSGRVRRHVFSLVQLLPPTGTTALFASVFVERAGDGTSLGELVETVRNRVSSDLDLMMAVDKIVALTLGNSLRQALEERFDYQLAKQSLAFYKVDDVPSISSDIPHEVSGVHFTSDITGAQTIDVKLHRREGGLFAAVL